MKNKFILCLLFLAAGACGFYAMGQGLRFIHSRQAVIRIGNLEKNMDYDLQAAVNVLKYRLEQAGYNVVGTSYLGNLYPEEFDKAMVNVFVRGYNILLDQRMNDQAQNLYYIHRNTGIFREEMRGYDLYLASQHNLLMSFLPSDKYIYFTGGYVPHQALEPTPEFDVLYIYEYANPTYRAFLNKYYNAKIFSGMKFAALTAEQKEKYLQSARLVVYEMGLPDRDDNSYVPYAVYDIISYGRPLLTNAKPYLRRYFQDNVFLFNTSDEMPKQTFNAFLVSSEELEKKGRTARSILITKVDNEFPFKSLLKKIYKKNSGV